MADLPVPPPEDQAEPESDQLSPAAPQLAQIVLNWSHFRPEYAGQSEEDEEPIFFVQMIG